LPRKITLDGYQASHRGCSGISRTEFGSAWRHDVR
jgi:hypothetical protein